MSRKYSHFERPEPIGEHIVRYLRSKRVTREIPKGSRVLDLGCGHQGNFLREISPIISFGSGFDISVSSKQISKKIVLYKHNLNEPLPEHGNTYDIVTAIAVIEHLEKPRNALSEAWRVLKTGGVLLITTPTRKSRFLLNFLAKINFLNSEEIFDHKRYFDKDSLYKELIKAGFQKNNIQIKKFELGFNLFAQASKK